MGYTKVGKKQPQDGAGHDLGAALGGVQLSAAPDAAAAAAAEVGEVGDPEQFGARGEALIADMTAYAERQKIGHDATDPRQYYAWVRWENALMRIAQVQREMRSIIALIGTVAAEAEAGEGVPNGDE